MSHYESYRCGRCINGFVMTGLGRKPCPYCMGKGYVVVEVEDEHDE
jgi:DNA-directed RNA polymerase subunit RPC12/RpoP